MELVLEEVQRIPTSGARAVEVFEIGGMQLLAIPQLAYDIRGEPPGMNGGDSDTQLLLLRRVDGRFRAWQTLPAPGGEDAEHFIIGDRHFLAVASLRSGSDPYEFSAESQIWTWQDGCFVPFQTIATYAAKQFRHWRIDGREFLGLAQGVRPPGATAPNLDSVVFEWDGSAFVTDERAPVRATFQTDLGWRGRCSAKCLLQAPRNSRLLQDQGVPSRSLEEAGNWPG